MLNAWDGAMLAYNKGPIAQTTEETCNCDRDNRCKEVPLDFKHHDETDSMPSITFSKLGSKVVLQVGSESFRYLLVLSR